jgi:hypothetical protein
VPGGKNQAASFSLSGFTASGLLLLLLGGEMPILWGVKRPIFLNKIFQNEQTEARK